MFVTLLVIALSAIPSVIATREELENGLKYDFNKLKRFEAAKASFLKFTTEHSYTLPEEDESVWTENVFHFHLAIHKAVKKSLLFRHYDLDLNEVANLVKSKQIWDRVLQLIAKIVGMKENEVKKGMDAVEKAIMLYTFLGHSALKGMQKIMAMIKENNELEYHYTVISEGYGEGDGGTYDMTKHLERKYAALKKLLVVVEHAIEELKKAPAQ